MWRWFHYLHFRMRGHGASWLAILGQVISVVGLPLPSASAKDRSTPFPCQHRACGCMSARDCWRSCCCFSAGQRVAWARDHEVEPPSSLVEEAAQEECCSEEKKPCCSAKQTEKGKSNGAAAKTPWLLVMQARHCRGSASDSDTGVPSIPPGLPTDWQFEWTFVAAASVC
jgi:hypothetical protein